MSVLALIADALVTIVAIGSAAVSVLTLMRRALVLVIVSAALLACALLLAALPTPPAPWFIALPVTLASLVTAVAGGSAVTREVLGRAVVDATEGPAGGLVAADGRELLRGGQVIGYLERLAVAGVIIAGHPEALAVVIAIKGVGRFSDLENAAVRERFIIGTLASWIWAGSTALVVQLVTT